MILIAALLLGGFLMYRWKKRKERQEELEAKLAAERKAIEEQRQAEEAQRRAEEEQQRLAAETKRTAAAAGTAGGGAAGTAGEGSGEIVGEGAEARAEGDDIDELEIESMTPEERKHYNEKKAILKLIDEKPAEVAWLIKTWLIEDE